MGQIATILRREFQKALGSKVVPLTALLEGQRKAASTETLDELVEHGHHPVHAIYTDTTNLATTFAEQVTALPPLHCAFDLSQPQLHTF